MEKLPIQKEYEGSVCEIKSMDNELIAIGRIKEVTTDNIKVTNSKKELKVVDYHTPIKINVFNAKVGFRVLVGSVYTSTRKEMCIDSIYNLVEKERRNFFRVDMHIKNKIVYKKSYEDDEIKEIDAVILDMSLSGMKIRTESELEVGSTFSVGLELSGRKESVFHCRILRKFDTKGVYNYYGSEFIYSKTEDADLLCSYLFKKQREFLSSREL